MIAWHIFFVIIFILGHITNSLVILVCSQKRLRKIPIFLFMIFESLGDILSLYSFSFGVVIANLLNLNLPYNYYGCGLVVLIDEFSSQFSAWVLVYFVLLFNKKIRIYQNNFFNKLKGRNNT